MKLQERKSNKVRYITVTAMLGAVASVLMMMSFSVPLVPGFLKMDLSEMPALIAAFSMGPLSGVMVCLIKNLVNMAFSTTGLVGELSNFCLGVAFVLPAGLIYRHNKTRKTALIGSLVGAAVMALFSLPSNYYVMYPIYSKFLPLEEIINMYQAIFPGVNGLLQCLIIFNIPFTLVKGLIDTAITFLIYKRVSRWIHGRQR